MEEGADPALVELDLKTDIRILLEMHRRLGTPREGAPKELTRAVLATLRERLDASRRHLSDA